MAKCGDASCSPGSATLRTLDAHGGSFTSITIGADGFPIIAYYDNTHQDLKVAKCGTPPAPRALSSCGPWISPGMWAVLPRSSIGADGFPIIAYHDSTNGDLKVAKCANADCSSVTLQTLDATGNVGRYSSITIGVDGFPVIAYYDLTNFDLKMASCVDASCNPLLITRRTLDATGDVGLHASITIGADGFPIIAYHDLTNQDLKVAKCGNTSCSPGLVTLRTLDTTGNVGSSTSITIGADGFPVIAYCDYTNVDLKVAKCGTPPAPPLPCRPWMPPGMWALPPRSPLGLMVSRSSPIVISPIMTLR